MKRAIKHIHGAVSIDEYRLEHAMRSVAFALNADPHHRLYSWDHSNAVWKSFVRGEAGRDEAVLNLAFYLASWGMYRGSSDLLFRDYKALQPVVDFLCARAQEDWSDCLFSEEDPQTLAKRIIELVEGLGIALQPKLARPEIEGPPPRPSSILLSKILLNTLECVPAFDTEVSKGLQDLLTHFAGNPFRKEILSALADFARRNRKIVERGSRILQDDCGITYPLTKVLDLYLWIHGNSATQRRSDR
jgi:hypothetical protein